MQTITIFLAILALAASASAKQPHINPKASRTYPRAANWNDQTALYEILRRAHNVETADDGKWIEAARLYSRAAELDTSGIAWISAAVNYFKAGQADRAYESLKKASAQATSAKLEDVRRAVEQVRQEFQKQILSVR